jgi:UDP-N-acetylmuramoylalanine--D-glutamate ligase
MEQSFSGRRVTVMGLGVFGAQIAAVRFLVDRGACVTVTDLRSAEVLQDSVAQIADLPGVRLRLGEHDERDFRETDLVVASPAVRPDNAFVEIARNAGVPVTSEIRLFWDRCRAPIVGVTGSNGKSTTTRLIHDILAADGRRVWLGGNIGRSLLPHALEITSGDWVVLELSSFQLADLDLDHRSPHVAVITNISANHLDWHGSQRDYVDAKQTLLRWQRPGDLVIRRREGEEADWPTTARCCWCADRDGSDMSARLDRTGRRVHLPTRGESISLDECPGLAGAHLQTAALLAATTGVSLQASSAAIRNTLQNFAGLPHRLQACGDWEGRRLVNDSASTTPESTIVALHSLSPPILLIAGGAEKGSPLGPLAQAVVDYARGAILFGDVRDKLCAEIEARRSVDEATSHASLEFVGQAGNLDDAVEQARRLSQPGETILFSPGFASGSMFRNFEHRGETFAALVQTAAAPQPGAGI